jgi:hypothetical protein
VAQRRDDPSVAEVESAFAGGEIVRTHVLRPTWHFVSPRDLRWLLDLTAPRVHVQNGSQYRLLQLDGPTLHRSKEILIMTLQGGGHATRSELQTALSQGGLEAEGLRLVYVLMHAELEGLICSGAPRGREQTYALVSEWAPVATALDEESALAEMTKRYFSGHGPATAKDLRWWSSLTMRQIQRGLDLVGGELESFDQDGETFWFTVPRPPPERSAPTAWLLQAYDEYIVGYQHSRGTIDAWGGDSLLARLPGIPNAGIFIDGQAVGRWRQSKRGASISIDAVLSRNLTRPEMRALRAAVDAFGSSHGTQADLVLLPVA